MPEIIAVRRNLSPGAVFFRQTGRVVEYSLDSVTWKQAFILPRGTEPVMPPDVIEYLEDKTIQNFIDFHYSQYINNISINNLTELLASPQTRIERNICAASQALAIAAATVINAIKEEEGDAKSRFDAAATKIIAAGISGAAPIAAFTRKLPPKVAIILEVIAIGMFAAADAIDYIASFDNIPDLLDSDDTAVIACYIYRSVRNSPNIGKSGLQLALSSQQFPDLPPLPQGTATAYYDIWEFTPDLYTTYLAALLDMDEERCECGGCYVLNPLNGEIVAGSGYPLLSGGVRTTPTRAPYGGNYKKLAMHFSDILPEPYINNQVDKVTLNFITTQYGQLGGQAYTLRVTIGGPGSQFFNRDILLSALPPAGVQVGIVADFSTVTLANGVSYVSFDHRTNYVEPTLDPNRETVFTGGEICLRGP